MAWPERWHKVRELRKMAAAQAFACTDESGAPTLILTSPDSQNLSHVARAHACIDTPHVARLANGDTSAEGYLAFACDAITDLEAVVATSVDAGVPAPYAVGIAFNEMMMDTVEAAHRAPSGPFCLGELAWSNVLVGPSGHCWLFGFGHNFALREEETLRYAGGLCRAPEVLLGMQASPASDVWVLQASLRGLLPYLKILDILTGAVGGQRPELRALRAALIALDEDAQATDPARRPPDIAALRARYREIRRLAGTMPDPDDAGLRALFGELAQRSLEPSTGVRLMVDLKARRLKVPGLADIDLSKRSVLWRIVLRLLDERRNLPGRAVDIDDLREAAWPGELILPEAARARIYVAISNLRKLGLTDVIVKRDEGYVIPPDVDV